ncbi:purine nucleoside permease [Alteromonas aestuariivivens]|uniref:Purine nucleoside permease n=1 Tax=Alteromonas aestuariivivens TaxID=1938339 RepID=A0A3D8MB59_9ALTE|nr:purine nucleoside permease [Alteromonas aestuariivivens]RDV27530.1 purine nucleoside permease [Alteromonas aestuariivivens]
MPRFVPLWALLTLCVSLLSGCQSDQSTSAAHSPAPLKVKAVVVTMFEIGEDTGDKAGEFQMWKERYGLDTVYPFPQSFHDIHVNEEKGVLAIVTGMGIARATAAIMALGLDPRFDLTEAYWLVAGIAGIDPADGTIGSAVWADYLIDGDLAHQIDGREIPEDWSTGYFPLFANEPYQQPEDGSAPQAHNGEMYQLNANLVNWAYQLTESLTLMDTHGMEALRSRYTAHPKAMQTPIVMKGAQMASSTFWHGELFNQWANDWTKYWTNGNGNFMTSGMEDTGSYQAMIYLDRAGKVDKQRFLVLRTASNFTMQPPGLTAAENLKMESSGEGYAGMVPSLEAAYLVGSTVVDELVNNWAKYQTQLPLPAAE